MSVEQIMHKAKRAREAYRRMVRDLEARGEVTMAKKAQMAMDQIKLESLTKNANPPKKADIVELLGGVQIANEDLPDYGIDPRVLYLMNEEQGVEVPGNFYGFPDGSMVLLKKQQ